MNKIPRFSLALAFLAALASAYAQQADLFELVKTGSLQDVKAAVDKGADVNARDPANGWTPLMYAARYNQNPEVLNVLLKAGAKVDARADDGSTPLMCAALINANPEVISALLKAGADVNARSKGQGWTALICAASFNDNPEVIATLLRAGANEKVKDSTGRTAFDRARSNDDIKGTKTYWELKNALN
ncbi:MAG: ankyrin repeat domain-containing protein [Rectinemataceae bacterium]